MSNPLAAAATGFFSGLSDTVDQNKKDEDAWNKQAQAVFKDNYDHYNALQRDYDEKQNQIGATAALISSDPNDKAARDVAWAVINSKEKIPLPVMHTMYMSHKQALAMTKQQAQQQGAPPPVQDIQQTEDASPDQTMDAGQDVQAPPQQGPTPLIDPATLNQGGGNSIGSALGAHTNDERIARLHQTLAHQYNMPVSEIVKISAGNKSGDDEESPNLAGVDVAGALHQYEDEQANRKNSNKGFTSIDPESGDVTSGPASFGFSVPQKMPTKVFNKMADEDSKYRQAAMVNEPIMNNIERKLDQLEPNLSKVHTGKGADLLLGAAQVANTATFGAAFPETATATGNIEKGTNDIAMELNKFQYVPGMRGSVLGLQTILASKPGVTQPNQTNNNIVASLRATTADYRLSNELQQAYREASPLRITDSNANKLDNALKTLYPLESIDKTTGKVTFNKDNIQNIRDAIPEAIANPGKFLRAAKSGKAVEEDTTPAEAPSTQGGMNAPLQHFNDPSDKGYQALASGQQFIDDHGKVRTKP